MPKKPTDPFGWIKFSKDGKVDPEIKKLSHVKELQEEEVTKIFIEGFNRQFTEDKIIKYEKLPERDHDFLLIKSGKDILLQVTELVDREFISIMTQDDFDYGDWKSAYYKHPGELPYKIDVDRMQKALISTIRKKIDKNYSKISEKELWLLVFTTFTLYQTVFVQKGKYHNSKSLIFARNELEKTPGLAFDEIWFSNLLTNPIRVWTTP